MSKHTPGPWTSAIYEVTPAFLERLKLRQWGVCRDEEPGQPQGELVAICGEIDPEEREGSFQSLADSYLIAAAPEMLDALKGIAELLNAGVLVRNTDDDHKSDFTVRMLGIVPKIKAVKDAIAKAEGSQS